MTKQLLIFFMVFALNTISNTATSQDTKLNNLVVLIRDNDLIGLQNQLEKSDLDCQELAQLQKHAIQETKDVVKIEAGRALNKVFIATFLALDVNSIIKLLEFQQARKIRFIATGKDSLFWDVLAETVVSLISSSIGGWMTYDTVTNWTNPQKIVELLKTKLDLVDHKRNI